MTEPTRIDHLVGRVADVARHQPDAPRIVAVSPIDDDPEHEARWRARRWASTVPTRFVGATIAGCIDEVRPVVDQWLAASPPRPNLIIGGPVGTGKSWTACAAIRPLVEAGAVAAFVTVLELLDELRAEMNTNDPATVLDRYTRADVIVLDDIGAERLTDWAAERLHALVDWRWREELPIVGTTNHSPAELADILGERTYSRLAGGATGIKITGADRRRQRGDRP